MGVNITPGAAAPLAGGTPNSASVGSLQKQRRAVIDLIAATRPRMTRVELLSTLLFRPDPDAPEGTQDRDTLLAELDEQVALQTQAVDLMTGMQDTPVYDPQVVAWIKDKAAALPTAIAEFQSMLEVMQNLAVAAHEEDHLLGPALTAIIDFGRAEFFETVTAMCNLLWSDLDAARCAELESLARAGDTLQHTLDRLAWIGKHVRLVAINASVEASRAGEAGRGLGVIAVEFKSLAEEIQSLVTNASDSIETLSEFAAESRSTTLAKNGP